MEWEDKVKLAQLGNRRDVSVEAKKEFQSYVLSKMNEFDGQDWDMFVQLTDIIIDNMKNDVDYWSEIYKHIKNVDCNDPKFGFRSGMRIAMIQTICEDELFLNKV